MEPWNSGGSGHKLICLPGRGTPSPSSCPDGWLLTAVNSKELLWAEESTVLKVTRGRLNPTTDSTELMLVQGPLSKGAQLQSYPRQRAHEVSRGF